MKTDDEEQARSLREQRLIIGPWDHLQPTRRVPRPELRAVGRCPASTSPARTCGSSTAQLRGNAAADAGRRRCGSSSWASTSGATSRTGRCPTPATSTTSSTAAAGRTPYEGDGALTTQPPTVGRGRHHRLRPGRPGADTSAVRIIASVPVGAGPVDQATGWSGADVLCFTTPVLEDARRGHRSTSRSCCTSRPPRLDTDFTGKLVDVFPDGRAYVPDRRDPARPLPQLAHRARAARTRSGLRAHARPVGDLERVPAGPRHPRVAIQQQLPARYDRNTNTGGVIAEDGPDQLVVATNRVLHGPSHPSRLVLPIIRR